MHKQGIYYNGSIGAATLRRDGFCAMVADGLGEIVTKELSFSGDCLFVNAECRFGALAAEVLGPDGKVLDGFSAADCTCLANADSTKAQLRFKGGALPKGGVRLRFKMHCASLYSFWVSDASGVSRGYVAGGGPAYSGLRDE